MALHPHRYLDLIQSAAARIAAVTPGALAGVHDAGADGGPTGAVSVVSGGRTWIANLDDDRIRVDKHGDATTDAEISGEPAEMFLHLWGRAPLDDIHADGDEALVRELRRRLAMATQ